METVKVFAYCCREFEEATRKAAGIDPLLSPPINAGNFAYTLEGYDLLYFDLHGEAGFDYWFSVVDRDIVPALRAEQIREADLSGAVVFAVNCYLADEDSLMLDALLDAGCRYVIGGEGKNYGALHSPRWAGLLGLWFRRLLEAGFGPLRALKLAKQRVRLTAVKNRMLGIKHKKTFLEVSDSEAIADTLAFRAYYRK
jgi:hypothetical protein